MTIVDEFVTRCAGNSDIVGHLPYLHDRASVGGCVALELGVRSGESTSAFLAAVEAHRGHLWSVDIDPPSIPVEWYDNTHWSFVQGDDLDPVTVDQLPHKIDLLFIDTSHTYRHTFDELAFYGPRVRRGGVILLHDTDLEVAPGSVADEDRGFPVRRAVQDWCKTQFLTPDFRDGWHGLGVIEVI
jgi:predicted O-methyltransferase YrrM